MKATVALVILLVALTAPADATTLEITHGAMVNLLAISHDVFWNFGGDDFVISGVDPFRTVHAMGPSGLVWNGVSYSPQCSLESPPCSGFNPLNLFFQIAYAIPNFENDFAVGETSFFTAVGTIDVVDPTGAPVHLDLVGEGFATWDLSPMGFSGFHPCCDATYTFIAPEPATFLLLAVGCIIGGAVLALGRRAGHRFEERTELRRRG